MSDKKKEISEFFREVPPFLKVFNITNAYPTDDNQFIVEFNPGKELSHSNGMVVQGGFVTGMLDCCMAQFLIFKSKGKHIPLTLDIDVKFLRPCSPGPVKTVARITKEGKSICFTEAVLYQNDILIATSSATNKIVNSPFLRYTHSMIDGFEKFLELIRPINSYDDTNHPETPDYSNINSWAAHPDIDGYQFFTPDPNLEVKKDNDVDVFYIHPTGCFEKTWNSDMSKDHSTYERTEIMLSNQITPFNDSCNIYAPEYRQATYFSYFAKNSDGTKAHDLAFKDILNSFNYFIENFNDDRPFIIMSHSQGALHAQRLVSKYIQNTKLQNKMICAYIIGYIIPDKDYEILFPNIQKTTKFNDTSTIISWCTVAEGYKRPRERTMLWKPTGWDIVHMDQKIYSVNPFSWTDSNDWFSPPNYHSSIITKADNYDFANRFSNSHSGAKNLYNTVVLKNFLARVNSVTGLLEAKGPLVDRYKKIRYFNGDLHSYDVMLFWGCLRKNIKDRINAFI